MLLYPTAFRHQGKMSWVLGQTALSSEVQVHYCCSLQEENTKRWVYFYERITLIRAFSIYFYIHLVLVTSTPSALFPSQFLHVLFTFLTANIADVLPCWSCCRLRAIASSTIVSSSASGGISSIGGKPSAPARRASRGEGFPLFTFSEVSRTIDSDYGKKTQRELSPNHCQMQHYELSSS